MELRGEVRAEDIILGAIRIETIFKAGECIHCLGGSVSSKKRAGEKEPAKKIEKN